MVTHCQKKTYYDEPLVYSNHDGVFVASQKINIGDRASGVAT